MNAGNPSDRGIMAGGGKNQPSNKNIGRQNTAGMAGGNFQGIPNGLNTGIPNGLNTGNSLNGMMGGMPGIGNENNMKRGSMK